MSDFEEVVKGRIIGRESGEPIARARVEVYDEDMVLNDYLGTALTDENGGFSVDFTTAEYKHGPFEGRPDIFLKVFNPITDKTTKSKVFKGLKGELADDDSVEIMNLGDTLVD